MSVKRTATFLVVGGALAVWLAAAATSGDRPSALPPVLDTPAIDAHGARLTEEIARLHERLRPTATPRAPRRNLFSFVQSSGRISHPDHSVVEPRPAEARVLAPVPAPPKLSGIAEDETAEGLTRTAVVSLSGQLFLVKEGEMFAGRYHVLRIASDAVEITDTLEGGALHLALR
jgi:hypothetical protein